jgi:hypothetical protein
MSKILLALWLVLAVALPIGASDAGISTDTEPSVSRIFLPAVEEPTRLAHLLPLKDTTLQSGEKEIRIWIGFGVVDGLQMVRISVDPAGHIQGEAAYSHRLMPKNPNKDDKYYYSEMAKQCKAISRSETQESCRPVSAAHVDWGKTYRSMVELGLWDLPDESKLPKPSMSMVDGFAMLVELRVGTDYRAYLYGNPSFNSAPEAQRAAKIMGIAGAISGVDIR